MRLGIRVRLAALIWCIALLATFVAKSWAHGAANGGLPQWWLRSALCVHSHEGSWRDPGAPFYGGMQFLLSTWYANGGGRYARYPHWATPGQQLQIAYNLWRRAGWNPWPNTARMCGLL
jgi:Transglycosylase-like domain